MKLKFLFFLLFSYPLFSNAMPHPNEGELLCFEYNNFDCGRMFSFDDTIVFFPFENCAPHEVQFNEISCNNKYGDQIFHLIGNWKDSIIQPGAKDTIFMKKKDLYNWRDDLIDVSFTISYVDERIAQYLNVFVNFVPNRGDLEVSPVQLPTVNRGDSVIFSALVINHGSSPVTLKEPYSKFASHYNQKLRLVENRDVLVLAEGEVRIEFILNTDDLLNEYSGSFNFETNEDNRKYHRFPIPYSGELISKGFPSIKFDSLVLSNFINKGDACQFEFWFENNGDEPLIIQSAKTSCGCLVATWPREPIKAGKRDVISIKYDSKRIGPINKSCTVTTNAPEPRIVLRVRGMVKNV
jgi:Protein of unknown function (DUF1573)